MYQNPLPVSSFWGVVVIGGIEVAMDTLNEKDEFIILLLVCLVDIDNI